jgi:aquaporin Z
MDFSKVKHESVLAELFGTFALSLAVLASVWGLLPAAPTLVVAGAVLALYTLAHGNTSGAHLNPAITLGLYSLKKIDAAKAVAYLIVQISGALLAMLVMSMFLEGELLPRLSVEADYRTFFAEFLGTLFFAMGVAGAVQQKAKGIEAALLVGGSLSLGILFASLGSNGLLNPAVATAVSSLNWSYVLGPIAGAVIGMSVYAAAFGKKGKL